MMRLNSFANFKSICGDVEQEITAGAVAHDNRIVAFSIVTC